jgi:hypothetical protein
MQQLVRLSTVYKRLGVSRRVAYYWASSGKLPGAVKLNDTWLINEQILEHWIEENTIKEQEPCLTSMNGKTAAMPRSRSRAIQSEYQPTSPEARALLKMLAEQPKRNYTK